VIKVKLRSRDHSSTNSKHACAEGSVTNLKVCYGKSADNFWLSLIFYWCIIFCLSMKKIISNTESTCLRSVRCSVLCRA